LFVEPIDLFEAADTAERTCQQWTNVSNLRNDLILRENASGRTTDNMPARRKRRELLHSPCPPDEKVESCSTPHACPTKKKRNALICLPD
jgi:hypothetical protein